MGTKRFSTSVALALTLSLAGGCRDQPAAPPSFSDAVPIHLPTNSAAGGPLSAGVWLPGPAKLEVTLAGIGSGSLSIEFEGRPPIPLLHVRLDDEVLMRPVELPPGGSRAARIHFDGPETMTWRSARLIVPAADEPQDTPELAGLLAGRDVIILLTDTLHAKHVSAWGYERPTTPSIDALASRGVRFARAYSQTSWTLPSVVSLFTGLQQESHGAWSLKQDLGSAFMPLPERFARAGYRTVALVQNQVAREAIIGRGFEAFHKFGPTLDGLSKLVEAARETCAADDDRPLFLYAHLLAPHGPYYWPSDGRTEFDPTYEGSVDGSVAAAVALIQKGVPEDHPDVRHLVALYDEYLRYVDERVGQIAAAAEEAADDGVVIVHTSDHGEAFMQHGYIGHAYHVYEELVHVPLTIAAPNSTLPTGHVVETPVSLMDLAPTLAEWCGLPEIEFELQGHSLSPLLREMPWAGAARPLFFSARYNEDLETRRPQLAVQFEQLKLIRTDQGGRTWYELFDLSTDPEERVDLLEERPVQAAALRSLLTAWFEQHRPTSSRPVLEIDAKLQEGLQALGYIEGPNAESEDDE